jgi:hypothetical protein
MAWGNSTNVVTTNLAAGTDSPALARQDLNDALLELKNVIDGRNTANGVAGLNASQKIAASQIPNELNSSSATDLTLDPATDKVRIEHIINLNPQTVAQLQGRTDVIEGDVAVCSNGDAGSYCLAVATGEDDSAGNPIWKRIALGSEISAT